MQSIAWRSSSAMRLLLEQSVLLKVINQEQQFRKILKLNNYINFKN
jgi:hypothetical protein